MHKTGRESVLRRGPSALAVALILLVATAAAAGEARFNFGVLGDRTGGAQPGVYEGIVAEMAFFQPDFIITVGDHIEGYTPDREEIEREWDEFKTIIEAPGIKYYLTPGNHDIWDDQSEEMYKSRYGDPNRAFKIENTRFIIFDVSRNYGFDDLSEEQVKWLRKELEKSEGAEHVLVFLHKPLWCDDFSFGRESELHNMFLANGVDAVFSGHYHRYFYTERDGIRYFGVGSSGGSMWSSAREGSFYCYLLCQVVGDSLRVELFEPHSFRPVDSVTMEGVMDLTRFKKESISLSEIRVEGRSLAGTARVSITIDNSSARTLRDTVEWNVTDGWSVEPGRDYVEVPPGEVGQLTAYVSADGLLFPAPFLRASLPYRDEEPVEMVEYLNVRRVGEAARADSAPVIEGRLSDGVWGSIRPETEYFGWRGGASTGDPTALRLAYDDQNLYVGVVCDDALPEGISAKAEGRDGFVGQDDYVGLLLQPDRSAEVFYQILVNPKGTVADRRIVINPYGSYEMNPAWDCPVKAVGILTPEGWTAEFAIPLASIGEAAAGSEWGFNFQRGYSRQHTVSNFQAPLTYASSAMGILEFK